MTDKTLTALNSYIEERNSEDMVERVGNSLGSVLIISKDVKLNGYLNKRTCTHLAKAAIKVMEGGEWGN